MSAAGARSPPETRCRDGSATPCSNDWTSSPTLREVVQVAAVLPDRFSARLFAAMLDRRPVVVVSAVEEAVRADLLIEDGEQMRFRHDLLREATRQSLPQSLRRAMERQSATVMLDMGAAPGRSPPSSPAALSPAIRPRSPHSAKPHSRWPTAMPSAASDLSKRALELLPAEDPGPGPLVTETIVLLNRATRYEEARRVGRRGPLPSGAPEERPRFASGCRR